MAKAREANSNVNVAVSSVSFAKSPLLMRELAEVGVHVSANSKGRVLTEAELEAFLESANPDAIILGTERLTPKSLDVCPNLKLVAKYGVGLDNVDEVDLGTRGIRIGWTPGVNRRGVAELALAFALGHFRNVFVSIQRMKAGNWVKNGGHQLSGKTVGIVGLGHTGLEFATLVSSLGCPVIYTDIIDRKDLARPINAEAVSYEQLLTSAKVVSFHVPLTEKTSGMLGKSDMSRLHADTLVINTSRGAIVDFEALCESVAEGRVGGFAADVFSSEPYTSRRWGHCDRLYFTPHIGGNSMEAVLAMGRAAIASVTEALSQGVFTNSRSHS